MFTIFYFATVAELYSFCFRFYVNLFGFYFWKTTYYPTLDTALDPV